MIYAQLNEENICVGISQLSGEVQSKNMLKIESYDITILGKKYEDDNWIELPKPPVEPTEEELLMSQTLLNQANIQNQLKTLNEINSKIILNNQKGE